MKKTLIVTAFILSAVLASAVWSGCSKKEEVVETKGKIYGTVTDFATGNPVANVNVKLKPIGKTTLTGSDGSFEFTDLDAGKYSLSFTKDGYIALNDDYVIQLSEGESVSRDVHLQLSYKSFNVYLNGEVVDTIDFGANVSMNQTGVLVRNDGSMEINVRIMLNSSVDWISMETTHQAYNSAEGYYYYCSAPNSGDGDNMIIKIDREQLPYVGENIGYATLNSGEISRMVVVKAIGFGTPVVSEVTMSQQSNRYFYVESAVIDDGGGPITEKGFLVQTSNSSYYNTSIGSTRTYSCGNGTNNFNAVVEKGDCGYNRVCAYATNGVWVGYSGWVEF